MIDEDHLDEDHPSDDPRSNPLSGSVSSDFRSLRKVEILEPLEDTEIEHLISRLPTLRLDKGNLLFTPMHRSNLSFFLLDGSVRIYKSSGQWELTLEIVHSGGMFSNSGAGSSFYESLGYESIGHEGLEGNSVAQPTGDGLYLGVYAQALRPARVAMMRHEHFGRIVREHPEVGLKAMSILERRLSFYAERMFDMGVREIPTRLARMILWLLEDEGVVDAEGIKIATRYTHEELATMVGSRRVAITRALRELRDSGVRTTKRQIRVEDLEALKQAAAQIQ